MTKPSKKRAKSAVISKSQPLTQTEEEKKQKESDEQLKAKLTTLQDRIKRSPELYKNDFKELFETFKAKLAQYKENPAKKSDELSYYMLFFAHVICCLLTVRRLRTPSRIKLWNS